MSAAPSDLVADLPGGGRTQIEFDDNLLLPLLYGERDAHLDQIERARDEGLGPECLAVHQLLEQDWVAGR